MTNVTPFLVAAAVLVMAIAGASTMAPAKKQPAEFSRVKGLAEKWARVFTVPVPLILTIAHMESSFRPGLYNLNERAMSLGGAWGVVAMTLRTGAGLVEQIRKNTGLMANPQVAATLSKWDPRASKAYVETLITKKNKQGAVTQAGNPGMCTELARPLLDPDLCLLLGVYMMSGLWHKYKDHIKVAAAYHSGAGTVDAAIKAGVPITSKLGPAGKEYVARATNLWPTYSA